MEKFIEKFNIFDIFTILFPGVVVLCLYGVTLSFAYYDVWTNMNNEKYVFFFAFAYALGIILLEMGNFLDKEFSRQRDLRRVFLLEDRYKEVFNNEIDYKNALKIKKYLKPYVDYEEEKETEEDVNSILFSYALNICEMKGLTYKSDKMLVLAEMSRSLFLGCLLVVLFNVIMTVWFACPVLFSCIESGILLLMSRIFYIRKQRYEKYRLRILVRTFLIYKQEKMMECEE